MVLSGLLQKLEAQIEDLPASFTVGSVLLDTEQLKLSLTQECRVWKRAFGAALNGQASGRMDEVFTFIESLTKRLQRPIRDLEDVREAMAALKEVTLAPGIGPVYNQGRVPIPVLSVLVLLSLSM